ncbi:MAG: hypothetical protein H6661_11115 [Ardenticatenaceae bacterium]|nr:hypothetical protein [Ardenticatenaceae bacterium]
MEEWTPPDTGDMSGMDKMDRPEDMTGMEMDSVGHDAEARHFIIMMGRWYIMSPADGCL